MAMPFWTRSVAAALLLGGCNLPSAALLSAGSDDDADRSTMLGLAVSFQPGLPILNAAAEAPAVFSRLRGAAARLNLGQLSLGEASTILEGELLQKGLLLPLPAGVLTIRTIAPEAPEPIAAAPIPVTIVDGAEVAAAELPWRQLPEVIGAYSAGRRTLLLATDGSFVISGPGEPFTRGTFFLAGQKLELAQKGSAKRSFAPVVEGWRDGQGEVYTLIHEVADDGAAHSARHRRGGR